MITKIKPIPRHKVLGWIFVGLFLIDSILNLYAIFIEFWPLSNLSKCFLMPLLAVSGLLWLRDKRIIPLYLCALIFHTGGDVFLIYSGDILFALGIVSFLIGHIFYLCIISRNLKGAKLPSFLLIYLPLLAASLVLAWPVMKIEGIFRWGCVVYASILLTLIAYSLLGLMKMRKASWIYMLMGAVLFTTSDLILAFGTFCNLSFHHQYFVVMLTYISAQALLTTGIVRMQV